MHRLFQRFIRRLFGYLNRSMSYDYLNRQTVAANAFSGGNRTMSYTYNARNQRTQASEQDGTSWNYEYDSDSDYNGTTGVGQVVEAARYTTGSTTDVAHAVAGQDATYSYDSLGNWQVVYPDVRRQDFNYSYYGDSGSDTGANLLNQYDHRTMNPPIIEMRGMSDANATVTVNGQDVERASGSPYWYAEIAQDSYDWYPPDLFWLPVDIEGAAVDGSVEAVEGSVFAENSPDVAGNDADGNSLYDQRLGDHYWDGEDRLVELDLGTGFTPDADLGIPMRAVFFKYDDQGRRVEQDVYFEETYYEPTSLISSTRYVYDGWNEIAEFTTTTDGSNATCWRAFYWGNDLSGTLQGAGGVGGLLMADLQNDSGNFETVGYGYDGNGNVINLTNLGNGTEVAHYEYDAFGNALEESGDWALANPFRFSTKYAEGDIYESDNLAEPMDMGITYYGTRYLGDGRWLSRDPIGGRGGLNLYAFCKNDPVNHIDPSGLSSIAPGGSSGRGNWNVVAGSVNLSNPKVSVYAGAVANSNGYTVSFAPSSNTVHGCGGKIVLYQIISFGGLTGQTADVDGSVPDGSCQLPPPMSPGGVLGGTYWYYDSPTSPDPTTYTFYLTAVAVCRCGCHDTPISTYYFTFSSKARTIDTSSSSSQTQYLNGLNNYLSRVLDYDPNSTLTSAQLGLPP